MPNVGLIMCADRESLDKLLARLKEEGLKFHKTFAFSLIGDSKVSVMVTAETEVLERITALSNFVNDYQI